MSSRRRMRPGGDARRSISALSGDSRGARHVQDISSASRSNRGAARGMRCAAPTQGIRDHVGLVATDRPADAALGKRRARSRGPSTWARTGIVSAVVALLIGIGQYSFPAVSEAQTTNPVAPVAAADQSCLPISIPVTPAPAPKPVPGGVFGGVRLSGLQVAAASTIATVGKSMKITRHGIRIAIAVAMQESSLNPAATKGPYIGLFQQRSDPGTGLYTQYSRLDATGATRMFFEQLVRRVPGYDRDNRLDWQIGEVVQETRVGKNAKQWFALSDALTTKMLGAPPVVTAVRPAPKASKPAPRRVTGLPG